MSEYAAPLADLEFQLRAVGGLDHVLSLPPFEGVDAETVRQILAEGGRFAGKVLSPINRAGDLTPAKLENGQVRTSPGFADAYRQFAEGGWNAVPFEPKYGGQGLPWLVQTALAEMWNAASLAFALCPLLNNGAIEALAAHGSEEQKRLFLPKLVSGEWTGTMNLTEPQAGSDLGQVRTRAVPNGDHYKITGQKIFITYGEHDYTPNIIHLVLARLPDAPAGTRGISLFVVPKVLVKPDGSLGSRNDLRCASLEHKLGIHGSPTCVMAYGDDGGATGYLVGEVNRGLEYMFTMMNNARLAVGLQGVAIAERAYQQALAYARQRVQSRDVAGSSGPVAIIRHPDVRRMLMTMKAGTEAARGLALQAAAWIDRARHAPEADDRARTQALLDLIIPVLKASATDFGVEAASIGIQVHGGMGFIEESGAAQHYRDARILPIYEGTNGIQANDLIGRKVARDQGATARIFLDLVQDTIDELDLFTDEDFAAMRGALADGHAALTRATDWIVKTFPEDPRRAIAGAAPYLKLFGLVAGGWIVVRNATAAEAHLGLGEGNETFLHAKKTTARFYAEHLLVQAPPLVWPATQPASTLALAEDQF
ncbi:MAG: acyl-CoA dehydrogenase [Alphaproteobacteria bacterium]|nr:acyl-CoA dehydrogenase [Alphaproteobacteria bacterium]